MVVKMELLCGILYGSLGTYSLMASFGLFTMVYFGIGAEQ
jgi:hypothetical protein